MRKLLGFLFIEIFSFASFAQKDSLVLDTLHKFKNVKFIQAHGNNFDTVTYSKYSISKVAGEPFYQIDKEVNSYWDMDLIYGTKKEDNTTFFDKIPKNQFHNYMFPHPDDRIYSQEINYIINGKNYSLLKHVDYNCYDPLCGSRHSHVTHITGVTYFSPDYGILYCGRNGNVTLEIMVSIEGINVPKDLILKILEEEKVRSEIIEKYKAF